MKTKNPFEELDRVMANKIKEQKKLMEDYNKLREYIIPFINQNKEIKELEKNISARLVALPISDLIINTIILTINNTMKEQMKTIQTNFKKIVKEMNLPKELFDLERDVK